MAFCKEFNAKTKDQNGMILPVVITVYSDKSFTFILKSPPASVLLKKAANIASGSAKPNQDKVGKVTKKQLAEIYKLKKADMNAKDVEARHQGHRRHRPQHGHRSRRLILFDLFSAALKLTAGVHSGRSHRKESKCQKNQQTIRQRRQGG
jgi:hypothetical protein